MASNPTILGHDYSGIATAQYFNNKGSHVGNQSFNHAPSMPAINT